MIVGAGSAFSSFLVPKPKRLGLGASAGASGSAFGVFSGSLFTGFAAASIGLRKALKKRSRLKRAAKPHMEITRYHCGKANLMVKMTRGVLAGRKK